MRVVGSAFAVCSIVLCFFQLGCTGTAAEPAANASSGAGQVTSISPSVVDAGRGGFLLTVKGADFTNRSMILWNGLELETEFVNSDEVTAEIPSQSVTKESTVAVSVKNVHLGLISNALTLTISGLPTITTTTLPTAQAGASYSAGLSVRGGASPFHWSMSTGTLPSGLAMNSQTGVISGVAEAAGNSTVSVSVTDSMNTTAKATLAINVAAAGQASVAGSSASSQFYGPGIGSDGLANTTVGPVGNTVSYRFRAKHSGQLEQAIVYLIPDHAGYAGGNGGTIQVTLHTDDGSSSHNPASTVLATYVMSGVLSLASPARYFYSLKFASPPSLTAGQLYHMVFKNIDASPLVNFLSVDDLYELNYATSVQRGLSTTDAAVLLSEQGGPWKPRLGFTPIYQLDFSNGVTEGIGYIEGWVGAPRPISGTNAVRETFTVSGADTKVSSVAIRVARVSGNDPLVVRLENASGTLIEEGSIPATAIPESNASSPSYFWARYTFASAYTLVPGDTYHIDLEATSTSAYQTFPIRKGFAYGFQSTTYFPDGYAEFEQSGTWTGWTQWGVANRTDGDLQFYFSVAP